MKVNITGNAVELTTTIPLMESEEGRNICNPGKALDIIGSFSAYLTLLLKRRKEACMKLLRSHINDIFYNNGFTIAWHRKDGTVGYFNIPTYETISNAIHTLQLGNYKMFLDSKPMVDQAIKAIMNEPELDHADSGSFKFSELVSVLCEYHIMPKENEG
jgi:hypothetical protein